MTFCDEKVYFGSLCTYVRTYGVRMADIRFEVYLSNHNQYLGHDKLFTMHLAKGS